MKRSEFAASARESLKNRQLREARERVRALEETNSILTAYLGFLIAKCGEIVMPRSVLSEGIGNFDISVEQNGENYLIKATPRKENLASLAEGISVSDGGEAVGE